MLIFLVFIPFFIKIIHFLIQPSEIQKEEKCAN